MLHAIIRYMQKKIELVKSPTFHNFADPILHNIVVKDIFAWVYLVSTEHITNRMSKLLKLATTVWKWIEIDIPVVVCCLFKVEAGNGEEEQKKILCGGGHPTQISMRYSERR